MIDYTKFGHVSYGATTVASSSSALATMFRRVYGMMSVGLLVSAAAAYFTLNTPALQESVVNAYFLFALAEIGLVMALSMAFNKLSVGAATILFFLYAALNGLTLSVIFLVYQLGSIVSTFFLTAAMFAGMAVYGTVTKQDLSRMGAICGMALWGLIIASLVNLFLRSSGVEFAISFVGVILFAGLTMWDAQKIRMMAERTELDETAVAKLSVLGALALYLDFINLFLFLLRFLGKRK